QDVLAVRRPANGEVRAGMVGEASRQPTGGGDDVHVVVAIFLTGERDLRSVGRENRVARAAGAGEPPGVATVARHGPHIAADDECHMGAAERGALEEQRLCIVCERGYRQQKDEDERGELVHGYPPREWATAGKDHASPGYCSSPRMGIKSQPSLGTLRQPAITKIMPQPSTLRCNAAVECTRGLGRHRAWPRHDDVTGRRSKPSRSPINENTSAWRSGAGYRKRITKRARRDIRYSPRCQDAAERMGRRDAVLGPVPESITRFV